MKLLLLARDPQFCDEIASLLKAAALGIQQAATAIGTGNIITQKVER